MRKRRRPGTPTLDDDGWVEFGGESIWAVGFTEGGAPYGPTAEEFEAAVEEADRTRLPRPNWANAKDVLSEIAERAGVVPDRSVIGRVQHIGDGLSNVVFGATIRLRPDRETDVVVKLPAPHARTDRDEAMRREAALLRYLGTQHLPIAIPRPLGEVETNIGLAAVQEWVDGLDVDLRAPRFHRGRSWEFVAAIAAAIHGVDPEPVRYVVPSHGTRRDHATAFAQILQDMEEPEARDAEMWIRDHLPPLSPASLLHGDLLGQNLRRSWDDGSAGVIDWAEALVGDPAYDLAIVTRGSRKPFALADGLARLIDAYNRVARSPVSIADVHVHELVLHAGFYRAAQRDYGMGSPHAEHQRRTWQALLRRVTQPGR